MALDFSITTLEVRRQWERHLQNYEGRMIFNFEFYTHPSDLSRLTLGNHTFRHLKSQKLFFNAIS